MRVRAGVVQMTSREEVAKNLDQAEVMIRRAREEGAKLVVLPEAFAQLGSEEGKLAIAEPLPEGGPILARFGGLAKELGLELVLGGFWETGSPGKTRNACLVLDAEGLVRSIYRKIHLFDVDLADCTRLVESHSTDPGTETVVAETVLGKTGLSVCYDLRFPELFRALVRQGATSLVVPAAFTLHTGKDHWHVLLRARAIESQAFVLAAAQTGRHNAKRVSYGHALICDPWGTVLAQCGDGPGVAVATLDFDRVEEIRRALPSLRHQRL